MKTGDTDQRERAAWEEVEKRFNFLAEAFCRADVVTMRMATDKLLEALELHLPLYEERSKSKLN
jgi:hypothetical protein